MKEARMTRLLAVPLLINGLAISIAGARSIDIARSPVAAVFNQFDSRKLNDINYLGESNLGDPDELPRIRTRVLDEGRRYFIDLGNLNDSQKTKAKQAIRESLGVSFQTDWLYIGRHKNALIFTPLRSLNDPALKVAVNRTDYRASRPGSARKVPAAPPADQPALPHVAFYVEVNRPILDAECTFPNSQLWERGSRRFCNKANISLVYRVNLMRSLAFGVGGSATPDAKLVRISLDDESSGAGIQLNDRALSQMETHPDATVVDGWTATHSTDAIARDYTFTITADDGPGSNGSSTSILKTYPASNLNANYERTEVSSFEIGLSRGMKSSQGGPKITLEPQLSFRQERTLNYQTQDYRVVRSSPGPKQVSFTWERQEFATPGSLLNLLTSPAWDNFYPIAAVKISPISYRGFTPNFDVIYKAAPDAKGVTRFNLNSSVNLWAIYDGIYQHFYVVGTHKSYQAKDEWQKYRRVSENVHFDVNWNHPVFTGGYPVNLQLGEQNNSCLAHGRQGAVTVETCDLGSNAQSFIYDRSGRYVSAENPDTCLDGNDLTAFKPCDASLTQRWTWKDQSEMLESEFSKGSFLAYDAGSKRFTLASVGSSTMSLRMLTRYTDIFSQ